MAAPDSYDYVSARVIPLADSGPGLTGARLRLLYATRRSHGGRTRRGVGISSRRRSCHLSGSVTRWCIETRSDVQEVCGTCTGNVCPLTEPREPDSKTAGEPSGSKHNRYQVGIMRAWR